MAKRISLREIPKPTSVSVDEDIEWLAKSFGLSEGRDTEHCLCRILGQLLHEIANTGAASTEELSQKLGFETQRINYHLRTLISAGLICREKRKVVLRHGSVKAAVEEMRKDANRIFDEIAEVAEQIDEQLHLKNRETIKKNRK